MKNERTKNILLVALLVAVVTLTIAYAALSATLTVNGTAVVKGGASNWKVEFVKKPATTCVASNYATVTTQPTINSTSFSGLVATFKSPGDKVTCTWNVENNGTIDAYLKTFTKPSSYEYAGTGTTKTADENIVKNHITYTLNYSGGGTITGGTSTTGDPLNASQDRTLVLVLEFDPNVTALPTADVTVTGFNTSFLYEQK